MQRIISSALWGKKDRGSRPRAVAISLTLVAALAAPAIAHAGGSVPPSLLDLANANPNGAFDVIIQTKGSGADPADAAISAITDGQRAALSDAVKTATEATKKATELAKKAADAAAKAAKAQQKANDAATKAAQTGRPDDQAAAARARAEATQALVVAQAAQVAAAAAQAVIVLTQIAIVQAQVQLLAANDQARRNITHQFRVIPAVSATITGADIVGLQSAGDGVMVAPDSAVRLTESNPQKWVDAVGAKWYWGSLARKRAAGMAPTIAIVDSGVDASRVGDFGGRVLGQVDFTSGSGLNSPGDGRGHGTMVASLAAGGSDKRSGVNPDARLVSLDVIDDNGAGKTSDVIAAVDWILQNRITYNIRVANFSLQSAAESSFMFDPLSIAVERLWLNGVVVVAAAGNYANEGAVSGVLYAPASDPFVITVGAVDIGRDGNVKNDVAAPWSAWGYTRDGFLKPEISAPGRYMIAAVPQSSTLAAAGGQDPKLVKQGYLELSGTSFASPIVAGAAAALLGIHPEWTPDQVKGALMVTANLLPAAVFGSVGVGEVDLKDMLEHPEQLVSPPNPNAALSAFVVSTPGGPVFDAGRWSGMASANASWSSASWSSAAWSSASWSSASWSSASWNSASWSSASWSSASWSSASWSSAATVTSLALVDNATSDGAGDG